MYGLLCPTTFTQLFILRNTPGLILWQRNYYERIIRDEADLNAIRDYILNNPLGWEGDSENPNHL